MMIIIITENKFFFFYKPTSFHVHYYTCLNLKAALKNLFHKTAVSKDIAHGTMSTKDYLPFVSCSKERRNISYFFLI